MLRRRSKQSIHGFIKKKSPTGVNKRGGAWVAVGGLLLALGASAPGALAPEPDPPQNKEEPGHKVASMAIRPRQEMCMGDLQGAIDSPQNSLPQPWYENQGHDDGNSHAGRREEKAPDSFPGIHICPLLPPFLFPFQCSTSTYYYSKKQQKSQALQKGRFKAGFCRSPVAQNAYFGPKRKARTTKQYAGRLLRSLGFRCGNPGLFCLPICPGRCDRQAGWELPGGSWGSPSSSVVIV